MELRDVQKVEQLGFDEKLDNSVKKEEVLFRIKNKLVGGIDEK